VALRSPRLALGAVLVAAGVFALSCAPEEDPVLTTMPPRTEDGLEVRKLTVSADSVSSATFVQRFDAHALERAVYGRWRGFLSRGFVRFAPSAFEVDTLAGATISNARFLYQCAAGQGDTTGIPVRITAVQLGSPGAWAADSLEWPGPPLDETFLAETLVENCAEADTFPEVSVDVPDALVQTWLTNPDAQNGFAISVADTSAVLGIAAVENGFLYFDDAGILRSVAKPRLSFLATRPGEEAFTYTIGSADITDTYVLAPDSAAIAGDPSALIAARLPLHRIILRPELPDLPSGSGVHRATVNLRVLSHPRHDRDLTLEVFRLTSDWPEGAPADSLVTNDGVLWHQVEVAVDADLVEVPITDLVQGWLEGTFENQGVLVRASGGAQDAAAIAFASGANPDPLLRPTLEITYTAPIGGRP